MVKSILMNVSFKIDVTKLGLFTELLQNEVSDLSITQVTAGQVYGKKTKPRIPKTSKSDPNRPSGKVVALEFVKRMGKGKIFNARPDGELGKALVEHNFSPTGSSPLTTWLKREGHVRETDKRSMWEIIK